MSDDPADASGANDGRFKLCKICAQDIPAGARKCTKCDSFQDWRGRLSFSTTILSLLIALISTTVAALPVLQAYAATDDSDIYVRLLRTEPGVLTVVAVNRGSRPGFIGDGNVLQNTWALAELSETSGARATLVPPGQFVQLRYRVNVTHPEREDEAPACDVGFMIINFRSNAGHASFTTACAAIPGTAPPPRPMPA